MVVQLAVLRFAPLSVLIGLREISRAKLFLCPVDLGGVEDLDLDLEAILPRQRDN